MYAIGQNNKGQFFATNTTRNLTVPGLEAGVNHTYDTVGPAVMALPSWLAEHKFQAPTDPRDGPFQKAFQTDQAVFEWFPNHPEKLEYFNSWMTAQRDGRANWLDFFPFEEEITKGSATNGEDGAVLFVDVGGAKGHEIQAIKERYPETKGKFVLQDLPDTIKQALVVPGMVAEAHDFFTEQPVKGTMILLGRSTRCRRKLTGS